MPDLKAINMEDQEDHTGEQHEVAVRPRPWLPILVGVNLLVSFFIMAMLGVAATQIHRARTELRERVVKIEQVVAEVKALRHVMASDTAEDIIYLKAMVLRPDMDQALARTIARSVKRNAKIFKRDPDFVLAMIDVESNFDPKAVSAVGALGLMQVMPHWKEKRITLTCELTTVDCSIENGLRIYGFYEAEFEGDVELALTAYNRGPGAVVKDLVSGRDPARNGYGRTVLEIYERLKAMTVRGP